jgi:hypothetical protein
MLASNMRCSTLNLINFILFKSFQIGLLLLLTISFLTVLLC